MKRLVMVTCQLRHVALWWGAWGLVVIWPLAWPRTHAPYWSLTWPRQSGGTLAARLGAVLVVWQGGRRRRVRA